MCTQVPTLAVNAHVVIGTFAVNLASHHRATSVWVSLSTVRTEASGFVVLWPTFGVLVTLVVNYTRVHTVTVVTSLVRRTFGCGCAANWLGLRRNGLD